MNASFRASSPYLVANSTACLPTCPAPMIVTWTGSRAGLRRSGQRALERGERRGDAVPGDAAQVLHEPAAVVARDHVEG